MPNAVAPAASLCHPAAMSWEPGSDTFLLSVKVLMLDQQGRCLLLRRSCKSKNNAGKWELPGGKSDPGEAFDVALKREVLEETGLSIRLLRPFATTHSDMPGRQVVYLVMLAQAGPGEVRLSEEHDAAEWVEPDCLADEHDICPQFRGIVLQYAEDARSQTLPARRQAAPIPKAGTTPARVRPTTSAAPRRGKRRPI